jgi:acetyl esterase/lipase
MTTVTERATAPDIAPAFGTEIPLWPDGAPGSEGVTSPEIVEPPQDERDHVRVRNVHTPSLTVFLAPKETATGAAMIVAPGGGHRWLSIDIEGYHVAEYLNSIGVSTFVLKYRLAREEGSPYQVEVHALQDAQRAIRLVRSRAAEWGVDPARLGMIGFSAGAQLTVLAATHFDDGQPDATDPVERQSSRPDFQALIYGGGRQLDTLRFTAQTPPAFLLGADDDRLVSEHLPHLYLALKQAGVPVELHIYVSGGHGFGMRKPPKPVPSASTWQLRLADWLADRGLLLAPLPLPASQR